MNKLHILTPVKDSPEIALRTIKSIMDSTISVEFSYTVYNDFSTEETTGILESESKKSGFTLVNLKEMTMHPSPNYLMILQIAQQRANFENAHCELAKLLLRQPRKKRQDCMGKEGARSSE